MVPFPYAQVHTVRICYFALITSWVVFLLFSLKNMAYIFSKKNLQFSVFHFASFNLNKSWLREDSSVSGSRSHMASSLHGIALPYMCGWHCNLCLQTLISGNESMQ